MIAFLRLQQPLIQRIIEYEQRASGNLEQSKAVVELVDGSRLHINEVWIQGVLQKYAYYWLTPTGTLLQGWDNAPHHPDIATYPHHTHTRAGIQPSTVWTLADVLNMLKKHLISP